MAIGVFGLQVAYKLKRLEVMSLDDTHGWFGGGSYGSTVDRIDFSNDTGTANIRGSLSLARNSLAATGNSNYGWFGGGYVPGSPGTLYSRVDRIDFSNDSSTASVRGPLSLARYQPAATGNSNYGWFGGGSTLTAVDRIDFSNDSGTTSPRGSLSTGRSGISATGNSNYGWFGGGLFQGPGPTVVVSTVDRIDFSNDSPIASLRGPLSLEKRMLAATGNSNYGWFGGGYVPGSPGTLYSTVDRIDFSNDLATASVRGSLSQVKYVMGATGNSNYGWFGGGLVPGPTTVSRVDRIDFSNDSVSVSPRGPLSSVRDSLAATSGQAKGPAIKLQKSGNYGWVGGGAHYVPPFTELYYSTVDRIDFSNDTGTPLARGSLNASRRFTASVGNSNYGWYLTGNSSSPSLIDRIDFSNDSVRASARGAASPRDAWGGVSNSNYGWYGGGSAAPGIIVSFDRINFSNDFTTASLRAFFPINTNQFGATENSNYGWFGGGQKYTAPYEGLSCVQRIDFSNDLANASLRGPLTATGYQLAATGNSNYGWFGPRTRDGGDTATTIVDRIDFSNDLATLSVRGLLNISRKTNDANGNSNYGWWFGGGVSPGALGAYSSIERINFSNDLATASIRGAFSAVKSNSKSNTNSTR